ncbi:MAG TPA: tyrosine-type recombinase/integrase [Solirubrobacterales bacterium]|nr:tyrosine-type recombinase/integrase [Solirubrobacterales bacterium]
MSPLRSALADYLTVRRALGYKLEKAEWLLSGFLAYLEERDAKTITIEHALAWATLPGGAPNWHCARLSVLRRFAAYMKTIYPACEVPGAGLLRARRSRMTPYIYSESEIAALIEAAATLRGAHRVATYRTLIGLLATTGMRIGEAIRLERSDLDLTPGAITVRETKFAKSRELPLHESTAAALRRYLRRADRPASPGDPDAVFVSTAGTRLRYGSAQATFARLLAHVGFEPRSARCRPRLHDLRHTFAVRTMLDAYREDGEVEVRLAALSTYLGHVSPTSTYWYLSAAPELMELAACRLERYLGDRS